jgi:2-polyprenyl-3-methyl-5-hydroxy-6-metoxy-1,4-benzoquinol methylase
LELSSPQTERIWEKKYQEKDTPWDVRESDKELVHMVVSGALEKYSKVVDLGCGTGTDLIYLAKNGFDVTGVDISPSAIKEAIARAKSEGVESRCNFYLADVLDLFFPKSKYDFAFDETCLQNITSSKEEITFIASKVFLHAMVFFSWLRLVTQTAVMIQTSSPNQPFEVCLKQSL